jgi:hypothetical protein
LRGVRFRDRNLGHRVVVAFHADELSGFASLRRGTDSRLVRHVILVA